MPFTDQGILFYSRDEEYGWLSNFWRAQEVIDGIAYKTNEHFYQSQKATYVTDRVRIMNLPTPKEAMYAGRALTGKAFRSDWDLMQLPVMYTGLVAKFTQNQDLKAKLLDTLEHEIHESSSHKYWGVDGEDHLGRLIMRVRTELKQGLI